MSLLSKTKNIVLIGLLLSLSGCADYMNHRDSITLGAGNASEANAAIHEQKSWPPDVSNTTIEVDGNRLPGGAVAVKK